MKKALIIIAIVAIVVIAGSMIYYYVFFRTVKEKAEISLREQKFELEKEKQRAEEIEQSIKQEGLAKCLDYAYKEYIRRMDEVYKTYIEGWNAECKRLGLKTDSALPDYIADDLTKNYQDEVDRAEKAYENSKNDCFKFWQD